MKIYFNIFNKIINLQITMMSNINKIKLNNSKNNQNIDSFKFEKFVL